MRVESTESILDLWKTIGYSPANADLAELENNDQELAVITNKVGGIFTPTKVHSLDTSKFTGVSIRQFPRNSDQG